ncbi:MAG: DMT family transporter [Desulfuromonas sp.]|nr:DMT family transporter [Desulfuromonas sp.]
MAVPAAYLGVILIWTTTPLAIKWSGVGNHFLVAVTSRMVIGLAVALLLMAMQHKSFPRNRTALQTYLAVGLGIYGSMSLVYWAAQYIPSGWISVLFGLNPIFTGLLAGLWLKESGLTLGKLMGSLLGVAGLVVIFRNSLAMGPESGWGIVAAVSATAVHCMSAIWVKRIGARIPALTMTAGGVGVAVVCLTLTWILLGVPFPESVSPRAGGAIVYLGVVGSVLGFALYYFVLKNVEATRVALITLITPVSALLLGNILNAEPLTPSIWAGTAMIMVGLLFFEFGFFPLKIARGVWGRG